MIARRFASCLMLALLCATGSAFADGPRPEPPASLGAKDHADDLFRQGLAAYDAGRMEEAERLFSQAWDLKKTHDIAGNLGVVELLRGRPRDAAEHIAWALRHMPPTESAKMRKGLEGELGKARLQVGAIRVQVNVPGASVYVNGKPAGTAPIEGELFVDAGVVKVEARRDGYAMAERLIPVSKGSSQEVGLALAPVPVKETWRPGVALLVTSGVLAVGGLAAGAGLTVAANGKTADVSTLGSQVGGPAACLTPSSPCTALHNAAASRDRLSDGALWSFVGGGAFTLATVGLTVWTLMAPKTALPVQVTPVVGAGRNGVEVRASW